MYRLTRPEWRLSLIAILVGALLSLYPAYASAQRWDKDDKGNQDNHGQMNKGDDQKHFDRPGDKHYNRQHNDRQHSDFRRFDRRDDSNFKYTRDDNRRYARDDNRWRYDRDRNRSRTMSRDNDRWRHDADRNWRDRRDASFRYYREGRWYRNEWWRSRPQTRVVYVFVPQHRERMREYFMDHRYDLPRYYYSDYYDELPYDVRRQLVVNGYFPEYLEDRAYPFPSALDRLLGPAPYGTRRVMFGRDAYLLQDRSNLILDVIRDIARL